MFEQDVFRPRYVLPKECTYSEINKYVNRMGPDTELMHCLT